MAAARLLLLRLFSFCLSFASLPATQIRSSFFSPLRPSITLTSSSFNILAFSLPLFLFPPRVLCHLLRLLSPHPSRFLPLLPLSSTLLFILTLFSSFAPSFLPSSSCSPFHHLHPFLPSFPPYSPPSLLTLTPPLRPSHFTINPAFLTRHSHLHLLLLLLCPA